jgi:hypothetical protein
MFLPGQLCFGFAYHGAAQPMVPPSLWGGTGCVEVRRRPLILSKRD